MLVSSHSLFYNCTHYNIYSCNTRTTLVEFTVNDTKTAFFCQNCGSHFPKWLGQCSGCKEWNSLVEEVIHNPKKTPIGLSKSQTSSKPKNINEIDNSNNHRLILKDEELNRILGTTEVGK